MNQVEEEKKAYQNWLSTDQEDNREYRSHTYETKENKEQKKTIFEK